MQFNELNLREEILRAVTEMGYTEPTDIQTKAIPLVLEGKDVIGRSSTGTGKTAAFGIPIIQNTIENSNTASVLILSPTRELAQQIAGEIRKFSKYLRGVSIATVYGGESIELQIRQLKTAKIVIGTPGRIMDHLRRKTLKLHNLETVVLDEADEMLNMGFIEDIETILETTPPSRQTLLFSATMPQAILKISKEFQNNPEIVKADKGQKTVDQIAQSYYNIPQAGKIDTLKLLIEYHRPKRALIFCNTKRMVDELAGTLSQGGFKAVAIHGDMRQTQRTSVMNEFKSGRTNILIATDVAARGIDVEDVEAVFNFDIPQEYEYYIHRIGRTGRAGKAGASYTLAANRNQLARIREIERYVGAPIEEKPVPSLENIAEQKMDFFAKDIKSRIDEGVDDGWKTFIETLIEEGYSAEDIATALCSKIQNKSKRLVAVRNVSSFGGRKQGSNVQGRSWIRVNIGSAAKIGPNFIVGAIVDATGLNPSKIGKINIFPEHTDVDLFEHDAQTVINGTKNLKIKGKPVTFSLANVGNTADKKFGGDRRNKNYSKPYNKRNDKSGGSYRDNRPYKRVEPRSNDK